MALTTYGDIGQRTANWAAAKMLEHARPVLVLNLFGQLKPIPMNKASSAKFRRPIPFATATTPLVEGVTPIAHKIRYEDITVNLQQYGDVVEITDRVADLSEDPVLSDILVLSGEQAAATQEELLWGILRAGTNRFFANGVQRSDVNTAITLNKQHAIIRALRMSRATPVTQMLSGSTDFKTSPVEGGWIAFGHSDLEHDIRALPGFVPVAQYGSRKPLCPEELGAVENVRYLTSPVLMPYPDAGGAAGAMKSTTGAKADVYPVVYISRDYYGTCPLAGKGTVKPMVLNPNTPRGGDPLGQRGTVGWKTYWAGAILNEAWGAVLESAVTAL